MSQAEALGLFIREAREKAGLSQQQVADIAGISRAGVSQLEIGAVKYPKLRVLNLVAIAIGIPPLTMMEAAGATLTPETLDYQVQWYARQLDEANRRRLVAIANALLAEQIDSQEKGHRSSSRRSR